MVCKNNFLFGLKPKLIEKLEKIPTFELFQKYIEILNFFINIFILILFVTSVFFTSWLDTFSRLRGLEMVGSQKLFFKFLAWALSVPITEKQVTQSKVQYHLEHWQCLLVLWWFCIILYIIILYCLYIKARYLLEADYSHFHRDVEQSKSIKSKCQKASLLQTSEDKDTAFGSNDHYSTWIDVFLERDYLPELFWQRTPPAHSSPP